MANLNPMDFLNQVPAGAEVNKIEGSTVYAYRKADGSEDITFVFPPPPMEPGQTNPDPDIQIEYANKFVIRS